MIRRSTRRFALVLTLMILTALMLLPGAAFAATATAERVDIQVDPTDAAGALYIVTATLPAGTPLPATVRLSMPQGATVAWAGEVLGGPLEDDPTVQPVIEHGDNGYDVVSLTLSKALRGQLELTVPGLLVQDGTSRLLRVGYAPVDAVGAISIAALVPAGGIIETATPGATRSAGPSNGTIISLEASGAAGREVALDVRYSQTAPPATATTGGSNSTVLIVIALVAAAFVVMIVAANKRVKRTSDDDDDEDSYSEETEDIAVAITLDSAPRADETVAAVPAATPAAKRGLTPQMIIIAAVALILGGAVFMMASGESPGTTKSTNEYTYKVLTDADGSATLTVPIRLSEADPAHESSHVFDAIAGVPGVRSAKVIYAGPSVEIEYDSTQVDETAIRNALTAGGYPPAG
ncbi:MAG: heavy-metal-associated domain-containing protein [Coriobacteriia bacterium]